MSVTGGKEMSGDRVTGPPPGRVDAFISYRRLPADTAFVDRLQEALTARGKHVWVDRAEIEPASDWAARINRGIEGAKAFIFVITPESVVSRECLRELEIAAAQRKLIVPVVLRDVHRDQALPEDLTKPNWIFFTSGHDPGSAPDHDTQRALDKVIRALEEDLPWRDAHTRLAVRTQEWASAQRDRSFLLRGSDLHAAEEWLGQAGQHQKTPPTALQTEYILASRKAAVRTQRTWRLALSAGLVVALALAAVAFVQRNNAQTEARIAQSHALAAEATADLSTNPAQSVSLALSATKTDQNASAAQALRLALAQDRLRMTIQSGTGSTTVASWNPARAQIAVTAPHNSVALWDAATGRVSQVLPTVHAGMVSQLLWDAAGTRLAAVSLAGYVSMWNVPATGAASPIITGGLNALIQADATPGDLPSLGSLLSGVWLDRDGTVFYAFGSILANVPVLDVATRTAGQFFRGSFKFGGPNNVVPSPDGSKLLVGGEIITFATGQQTVLSPPPPGGPVRTVGSRTARPSSPRRRLMREVRSRSTRPRPVSSSPACRRQLARPAPLRAAPAPRTNGRRPGTRAGTLCCASPTGQFCPSPGTAMSSPPSPPVPMGVTWLRRAMTAPRGSGTPATAASSPSSTAVAPR
jgi:hypothetical protein